MKLIVCVDEKYGMAFFGKRLSQDRILQDDVLRLTEGSSLIMSTYSAAQFDDRQTIVLDENFLENAGMDDYCFAEVCDISPFAEYVSELILYRWNRHYPSDLRFPVELFDRRWQLLEQISFAGSSHERITREVYAL